MTLLLGAIAAAAFTGLALLLERQRRQWRGALAASDARLDQALRDMRAASAELDSFSYTVAHDLRAPLRAIDGFSRALIEDFGGKLEPEAARLLDTVRRNAVRMGALMDDLLGFSRLLRQPLAKSRIEPAAIVRRLIEDGAGIRRDRDISFDIGALPACDADPTLATRLFAELIGNAVKFTARTEGARIAIGSREENGRVVYVVADNGAGFDMAFAGKLFGVFQRLHRDEDFDGNGVGLAIAQRIVHRHGGEIWVEAAPGRGATFSFTLSGRAP